MGAWRSQPAECAIGGVPFQIRRPYRDVEPHAREPGAGTHDAHENKFLPANIGGRLRRLANQRL
jgi:hypothetical protein